MVCQLVFGGLLHKNYITVVFQELQLLSVHVREPRMAFDPNQVSR